MMLDEVLVNRNCIATLGNFGVDERAMRFTAAARSRRGRRRIML